MHVERLGSLRRPPSRWLSLALVVPLSLILLLQPLLLLDAAGGYSHATLMLILWGVAAGYVHGLGFDPQALGWRVLLHPLLAWGLMGLGYGVLFG
ncbi:cyd operon YbgE family protein [Pseudomonas sp. HR96]|uniref:cyd operon YbgE family protein n=1 Tax=Pseudomonas sp. HR96 TaxID=1027966 RepID=UPI002A75C540|nr:cyd operon YbgE family protein [Pseudomonas sp. HR96]WPO97831.1 cyd operon YbgE family protein [Pseudomonas sp. HR96]